MTTQIKCEPAQRPAARRRLKLANGAAAAVVGDRQQQRLRVYSPEGRLLFEYDCAGPTSRVFLPDGDLELVSGGRVHIAAAGGISLAGPTVKVEAEHQISLAAGEAGGGSLDLRPGAAQLSAPRTTVIARRLETAAEETVLSGDRLEGRFRRVRWLAGSLETVAHTVSEKAGDVFRAVSGLLRVNAGRTTTLVREDARTTAQTIVSRSTEDTKIEGRQIHLG